MAEKQLLFDAGYVDRTAGAFNAMRQAGVSEWSLLERHQSGDFGEVGSVQRHSNRRAIASGGRVFSVFLLTQRKVVWVITELDRQTTTVLLPCEFAGRKRSTRLKHAPPARRIASAGQAHPSTAGGSDELV
jgi:hypothetical protein